MKSSVNDPIDDEIYKVFQTVKARLSDQISKANRAQAFPLGALAFFNSGKVSGASQAHKHIQVVPLPLGDDASHRLPFEPVVRQACQDGNAEPSAATALHGLPFQSWCCMLSDG